MRTIKFDDLDSYRDLRLVRKGVEIGAPETKTETVDVPGADGALDLTEYFGEPLYENRELKMDFQAVEMGRYPNIYPSAPVPCDMDVAEDGSITIHGNTRQNLWRNNTTSHNGVSVTANADGSFTVSGTASGTAGIMFGRIYTLRPGATYTASVDRKLADEYVSGGVSGACFYVSFKESDGTYIKDDIFGFGTLLSTTRIVPEGAAYAELRSNVSSGTTVSGTYRVMLNEGGTAQPWCPPGLNGVDELSVVCAGKNLIQRRPGLAASTIYGVTFTPLDDGGILVDGTASQTAFYNIDFVTSVASAATPAPPAGTTVTQSGDTDKARLSVNVFFDDGSFAQMTQTYAATATIPNRATHLRSYIVVSAGVTVDNVTVYPQLEIGSTATDYEPPQVTTTPVDLDGHTLNSLPDGTRDELSVDATGAVTLTQRVGVATLPGDAASWVEESQGIGRFMTNVSPAAKHAYTPGSALCDALPYRVGSDDPYDGTNIIAADSWAYATIGDGDTASLVASACGGKTLLYALATPQTTKLPSAFIQTRLDFQEIFAQAYNSLHGKRMRIQLSEEPGFYYVGRVALDSWKTNERTGDVTITADCEPYKYRATETVVRVSVSGSKTVTLRNLRKTVVPTFQLSAAMQVKQGSATYSASQGAWSDDRLRLAQGDNELTFTGTGTVEIRYQERGL